MLGEKSLHCSREGEIVKKSPSFTPKLSERKGLGKTADREETSTGRGSVPLKKEREHGNRGGDLMTEEKKNRREIGSELDGEGEN